MPLLTKVSVIPEKSFKTISCSCEKPVVNVADAGDENKVCDLPSYAQIVMTQTTV